ncbi:unnamed protein product, partial [Heterosigma akashiwo]
KSPRVSPYYDPDGQACAAVHRAALVGFVVVGFCRLSNHRPGEVQSIYHLTSTSYHHQFSLIKGVGVHLLHQHRALVVPAHPRPHEAVVGRPHLEGTCVPQ